jgi:hypothetical protein
MELFNRILQITGLVLDGAGVFIICLAAAILFSGVRPDVQRFECLQEFSAPRPGNSYRPGVPDCGRHHSYGRGLADHGECNRSGTDSDQDFPEPVTGIRVGKGSLGNPAGIGSKGTFSRPRRACARKCGRVEIRMGKSRQASFGNKPCLRNPSF